MKNLQYEQDLVLQKQAQLQLTNQTTDECVITPAASQDQQNEVSQADLRQEEMDFQDIVEKSKQFMTNAHMTYYQKENEDLVINAQSDCEKIIPSFNFTPYRSKTLLAYAKHKNIKVDASKFFIPKDYAEEPVEEKPQPNPTIEAQPESPFKLPKKPKQGRIFRCPHID